MFAFVIRRAAFAILLVFFAASAAFFAVHLSPGDHFTEFGPGGVRRAHAERVAAGFDRPVVVQYWSWLSHAVRLDLGTSLKFQRPVRELVVPRTRNTLLLKISSLTVATLVGIPLGVVTAMRDRGLLRSLIRASSSAVLALPPLVVALGLTAVAARSGWLPPAGLSFSNMVVPALALALPIAALLERMHSQAVRHTLAEPWLQAAIARGISRRLVTWKHAMRGALGTTLGVYGVLAGGLLSGSFAVELIADWPGLALLMAEAVRARDPFLVCGCAAAAAMVLAGVILVTDLLHFWADPRVARP